VTHDEIRQAVRATIVSVLPHLDQGTIQGHQSLKDLGADSVERIEIIMALRRQLAVSEPLARFSTLPNIDALEAFLAIAGRS
jgi:polyketide biosynthesis acyl carrier protein